MQKTTISIDASAIKESSCGLRLFYNVVIGYKEKFPNNDIVWGKAFHTFREKFRVTRNCFAGMTLATKQFQTTPMHEKSNKQYLTTHFITDAAMQYEIEYENDMLDTVYVSPDFMQLNYNGVDKVPLVEPVTRFSFPYIVEEDIDVLVCGTMDELAKQRGGNYLIVDCKTTGAWDIRSYFQGYHLDPQLLMYRFALKEYAKAHPDSIWDQIDKTQVGCMIEGVFYKGGTSGGRPSITFKRSDPFYFQQWQLDEFDSLLTKICRSLIEDVRRWKTTGKLPLRQGISNSSCTTKYGLCKYFGACVKVDAEARESELEYHFIKKQYNPLNF